MLLTKEQILRAANQDFPEYLNIITEKEKGILKKSFKTLPKVTDVYVRDCKFKGIDVSNMEVIITLKISQNMVQKPNFVCNTALSDSQAACVFMNAPQRQFRIFLKYFINYFFYEVLLEKNETSPNEWNTWDKTRKRTLKLLEELK